MSYFEQCTNIRQMLPILPWRKRLMVRWHLWRLSRIEARILGRARSALRRSGES